MIRAKEMFLCKFPIMYLQQQNSNQQHCHPNDGANPLYTYHMARPSFLLLALYVNANTYTFYVEEGLATRE